MGQVRQPQVSIPETLPNSSQVAQEVCTAIQGHRKQEQDQSPPGQTTNPFSQRIPEQRKEPDPTIERDHPVRPGYLPAHRCRTDELAQEQGIDGIHPGGLDIFQGICNMGTKQEIRAFRQLVAEERIDEIGCLGWTRPTQVHENRSQEG